MFAIRVSADGRVIDIPAPPEDEHLPPSAVAAILLGSVGFDWGIDPLYLIEYTTVTEDGLVVIAASTDDDDPRPVNLPGEAVIRALQPFGVLPLETGAETHDSVWVLQVVPESLTDDGPLRFVDVPADVATAVRTAAESAPVTGRAVASVHVPDSGEDDALRALIASLGDVEGVSVMTLDPADPSASLAFLARELGEAPPEVYADVSNVRD